MNDTIFVDIDDLAVFAAFSGSDKVAFQLAVGVTVVMMLGNGIVLCSTISIFRALNQIAKAMPESAKMQSRKVGVDRFWSQVAMSCAGASSFMSHVFGQGVFFQNSGLVIHILGTFFITMAGISLQAIAVVDMVSARRIRHLGSTVHKENQNQNCCWHLRSISANRIMAVTVLCGPIAHIGNWLMLLMRDAHTFENFLHGWSRIMLISILVVAYIVTQARYMAVKKMKEAVASRRKQEEGENASPKPYSPSPKKGTQARQHLRRQSSRSVIEAKRAVRLNNAWRKLIKGLLLHVMLPIAFVVSQVIGSLMRVRTAREFARYVWVTNFCTVLHALMLSYLDQRWAKRKRKVFGISTHKNRPVLPDGKSVVSVMSTGSMLSSAAHVQIEREQDVREMQN